LRTRIEGGNVQAPIVIETPRLLLRPPTQDDTRAIFRRYASIPEVTRYLAWPRHRSLEDTLDFLEFSDLEWERWPAGPYLILTRHDEQLIGSTGLAFESPTRASTGYVLARDAWGKGLATEAVQALVPVAVRIGVRLLYAVCHPEHRASARVLEKSGFKLEGTLHAHTEFPNLRPGVAMDVMYWVHPAAGRRDAEEAMDAADQRGTTFPEETTG
jgi:RimJ/RimL family protein N-acetyltransferase